MPSWLDTIVTSLTDSKIWSAISSGLRPQDYFDIAVVAFIIYNLLLLTRATRANQVLKGLGILVVCAWLSSVLQLNALNFLFDTVVSFGVIALIVLFQPELRRVLSQIGQGSVLDVIRHPDTSADSDRLIDELIRALLKMSKRKVGALIVVERKTLLGEIIETGTRIDAEVSAALIENIFEPNTPLHDGAVVLRGFRVAAASCFLQLTDDTGLSRELGTRHRAALGITETTDALSLIVSEETGIISAAQKGKLTRYLDAQSLRELLETVYTHPEKENSLKTLIKRRNKHE